MKAEAQERPLVVAGQVVRLGSYGITRALARGGMADLYRGKALGRSDAGWVVLKLMRTGSDHVEVRRELFARERRLAEHLRHPNIVEFVEAGAPSSRPYIVLQYVAGRDAESLVRRARDRLPVELVLSLGAQAARGLGYAHRLRGPKDDPLGIVHRDVSPGNLRVGWDGVVKVLDFGVAKVQSGARPLTRPGELRGKYAYMSPEQASGEEVDSRSDVFSLGVVMYELLTGRAAFRRGGPVETMEQVQTLRLPLPSTLRDGVSIDVDQILARCLSKNRDLRYPDGAALADALESYLEAQRFHGERAWADYLATAFRIEREHEMAVLAAEDEALRAFVAAGTPRPAPRAPASDLRGRSVLVRTQPTRSSGRRRRLIWATVAGLSVVVAGLSVLWTRPSEPNSEPLRLETVVIEAGATGGGASAGEE